MTQTVAEINPSTLPAEQSLKAMAMLELDKVNVGITALREKYAGQVYEVTTTTGMKDAKQARLDIRERRYQIPKIVDDKKRQLREIGNEIDAEGERIKEALLEIEKPIDDQIKAEEERKAEAKRLEEERKTNIKASIDKLKQIPLAAVGMIAVDIKKLISDFEQYAIGENYQEFKAEAEQAKAGALETLRSTLATREQVEAEDLRLTQEREDLARLDGIKERIRSIQDWPRNCMGKTAQEMECAFGELASQQLGDFQELQADAGEARTAALTEIQRMIDAAKTQESAAADLKKQQEALELQQQTQSQKEEDDRKERERVDGIKERIREIRAFPLDCMDLPSARIRQLTADFKLDKPITGNTFAEYTEEAEEARIVALGKVTKMIEAAGKTEEQERLAEEQRQKEAKELQEKQEKEHQQELEKQKQAEQTRLEALTATHATTLEAILAMTEDKALKPAAALSGIAHLARLGLGKNKETAE